MATIMTSTPTEVLDGVRTELLIDGEWRPSSDGETLEKLNPATEDLLAQVSAATEEDVDAAVRAARTQLDGGEWSMLSGVERGQLLNRLADLIERDFEKLATIQSLEGGQPLMEPKMLDIPMTVGTFRHFAGWADKITGTVIPTPGYFGRQTHSYTRREPVGVIAAILPWNAPAMIFSWKVAAALACGNTLVVKPSEDAMLNVNYLGQLIEEAGFPAGVVNIVNGLGETTGAALVRHSGVDKISFTGSYEVGRVIGKVAAESFKRVTLELGGKSPQIIFADANLEAAIQGTAMGVFANQGQVCAAGTRILVERPVYDQVVEALGGAAQSVRLGNPLDPETQMGALINKQQLERVLDYIRAGKEEGAKLVAGGERSGERGYFVQPTIFADASNDMRIAREEIFGPVGTVIPFDGPDEAERIANDSFYGLAATIWTQDISKAHTLAAKVRAGTVWINGWGAIDPRLPWGGVKGSGVGRELGWAGIEANTEEKVVTVVL
jgi:acyl-CoA reductase-like NAD-dependent aldehyde dehydrogenase